MLIAVDGSQLNTESGGISNYSYNLVCEISKLTTPHEFIVFLEKEPQK